MEFKQTTGAIRLNDTTDHGGIVIAASSSIKINSVAVALEGDSATCPKCGGVHRILAGSSNSAQKLPVVL